jgi:hypothetical protein
MSKTGYVELDRINEAGEFILSCPEPYTMKPASSPGEVLRVQKDGETVAVMVLERIIRLRVVGCQEGGQPELAKSIAQCAASPETMNLSELRVTLPDALKPEIYRYLAPLGFAFKGGELVKSDTDSAGKVS